MIPMTRAELDGGSPEGMVLTPEHLRLSGSGQILAKGIAHVLESRYPGWNWGITVDEKGGVVHVFALILSGDMGYTMLIEDLQQDVNLKRIITAGGEILERYGCRRAGFSVDQFRRIKKAPDGSPIPDVTDNASLTKMFSKRSGLSV